MKLIQKRQKTDREDEVVVLNREDEVVVIKKEEKELPAVDNEKLVAQGNKVQKGWKVREELYGILPSFRSPNQIGDHKKKHKLHKNFKLKI